MGRMEDIARRYFPEDFITSSRFAHQDPPDIVD